MAGMAESDTPAPSHLRPSAAPFLSSRRFPKPSLSLAEQSAAHQRLAGDAEALLAANRSRETLRRNFERVLEEAPPNIVKRVASQMIEMVPSASHVTVTQAMEQVALHLLSTSASEAAPGVPRNANFELALATANPEAVKRALCQVVKQLDLDDYASVLQLFEEAALQLARDKAAPVDSKAAHQEAEAPAREKVGTSTCELHVASSHRSDEGPHAPLIAASAAFGTSSVAQMPLAQPAAVAALLSAKDSEDAALENMIHQAALRSHPQGGALQLRPSVGTWLFPKLGAAVAKPTGVRALPALPAATDMQAAAERSQPPTIKTEFPTAAEAASVTAAANPQGRASTPSAAPASLASPLSPTSPAPASPASPGLQDCLELHFVSLDFDEVDHAAFMAELREGLINIGFPEERFAQLKVTLRPGWVVAELRGPLKVVQQLRSMAAAYCGVKVMGCQACSASQLPQQLSLRRDGERAAAVAAPHSRLVLKEAPTAHLVLEEVGQDGPLPVIDKDQSPSGRAQAPPSPAAATSVSPSHGHTLGPAGGGRQGAGVPSQRLPLLADDDDIRPLSGDSRTPLLSLAIGGSQQHPPSRPESLQQAPESSSSSRPRTTFRRTLSVPTVRRKAGPQRLRARDSWNIEELRISDVLSRLPERLNETDEGLDEPDLAEILEELYGEAPAEHEVHWTFVLAARGKPRCNSPSELHNALRAHHACHYLPSFFIRKLAETNVGPGGAVKFELLQQLLEELNSGHTVPASEVNAVLDEAAAMDAVAGTARKSLLRAVAAWYFNVERSDSSFTTQLRACWGRWVPEKGYHTEAFHDESPDHMTQVFWGVLHAATLFAALVLPSVFFLCLVLLGAEHGDDRCPRDLDGLITWFGVLGLANIVVGCADGAVISNNSKNDDTAIIKTPCIGVCLKLALLLMPWIGASWTFHLRSNDEQTCGLFLTGASSLIWTVLLISELLLGFAFLWLLAVFAEYEMTLRQSQVIGSEGGLALTPRRLQRGQPQGQVSHAGEP
eukprot:TRINITY_DN31141_c1_g1_i4.p1 TRINITY_DN31141_c1_g1~~TRINITY_DN31141_c1_g1_i4.p1  ORF type:complete len:1013 (+),score=208.19 TRINITY_DN31141_c1_g1_i4:75-3113(+)